MKEKWEYRQHQLSTDNIDKMTRWQTKSKIFPDVLTELCVVLMLTSPHRHCLALKPQNTRDCCNHGML